mmetsp:Transcript_71755/g.99374  ORF Transcript_71755/g.99374 Transcript_71755/m.99374 type:complete len:310 (+) Transcript_71755:1-930(+)
MQARHSLRAAAAAAQAAHEAAVRVVRVVAEVLEVHEDGQCQEQGLGLGIHVVAEVDVVVVHVGRQEKLAEAGDLLRQHADLVAVSIQQLELDFGAGPAGEGAAHAPLAAPAVGRCHGVAVVIIDGEVQGQACARVVDGAQDHLPAARDVLHLHSGAVDAAAGEAPAFLHEEARLRSATAGVEDVHLERRAVFHAVLELPGAAVGLLHGVEELITIAICHRVLVRHLDLLAEERGGRLQHAHLLLDHDLLHGPHHLLRRRHGALARERALVRLGRRAGAVGGAHRAIPRWRASWWVRGGWGAGALWAGRS